MISLTRLCNTEFTPQLGDDTRLLFLSGYVFRRQFTLTHLAWFGTISSSCYDFKLEIYVNWDVVRSLIVYSKPWIWLRNSSNWFRSAYVFCTWVFPSIPPETSTQGHCIGASNIRFREANLQGHQGYLWVGCLYYYSSFPSTLEFILGLFTQL